MSGHSKWATIHRKKGLIDAERGKVFQKIAKEIYVAARGTDGNPDSNAQLRMVLEKAKAANMPKDNIKKAIDKATGAANDVVYEAIRYEGYGPGGIAVMVDCLTDNRNRTASSVRANFTKHGGNLGTDGSVSYLFARKGYIIFNKGSLDADEVMMVALDAGAEDFEEVDDTFEVTTSPEDFLNVKDALTNMGIEDYETCEVTFIPGNYVSLDDETREKAENLLEALEENEDVQNVYHNLD